VLLLNSYHDEPRGGGTEVVLAILAQGLTRLGHEGCVVSTRAEAGRHTQRRDGIDSVKLGIHNVYWPLDPRPQPGWKRLLWHAIDRFNPRAAREVVGIARDFKPDIISVHNVSGFSVAVWPQLKRLGVPMTQMLHDYQLSCAKTTLFDKGHI
jgi:glycosyltransferase involved in cell wall biosynthesis